MKVAIVGSRDFGDMAAVRGYVLSLPDWTTVISGGARGVDRVAVATAQRRGLKVEVYRADWDVLGKGAGMARNATIVEKADIVVAFWDGKSRGTANTIDRATRAGKLGKVFR